MSCPGEFVSGPPRMRSITSRTVTPADPTTKMVTSPRESARTNDDRLSIRPGSARIRAIRSRPSNAGMIHLGPRLKPGGSRKGNVIATTRVRAIGQRGSPGGTAPSVAVLRGDRERLIQ